MVWFKSGRHPTVEWQPCDSRKQPPGTVSQAACRRGFRPRISWARGKGVRRPDGQTCPGINVAQHCWILSRSLGWDVEFVEVRGVQFGPAQALRSENLCSSGWKRIPNLPILISGKRESLGATGIQSGIYLNLATGPGGWERPSVDAVSAKRESSPRE